MDSQIHALVVGNSRVQRAAAGALLDAIAQLEIVYSVRSNERAIARISTGDIDAVFLLLSEQDHLEDSFLSDLSTQVNARVPVIPVTSGQAIEGLRRLRSFGIRTPHHFRMPMKPKEELAFIKDIERALSIRPNKRDGSRGAKVLSSVPDLVCVVSSTGGPEALGQLLSSFEKNFALPVLVTQHMPENFIDKMCENLGRHTKLTVLRATDGEEFLAGHVYVAPGNAHLCVRRKNGKYLCVLDTGPPSAGCRPAGNVMLASAAKVTKGKLVAVCLTGMGKDGTMGMGAVREAGGIVIVQDEASSVVWGMPGSIVQCGYENHVLPLGEIANKIKQLATMEIGADVSCAS